MKSFTRKIYCFLAVATLVLSAGISTAQTVYNNPSGTFTIACAANKFYDVGGVGGNYNTNNLNQVTTFCAPGGQCLRVVFYDVNTESGYDFLYIYNGPTTASPLLGTYTGNTIPPVFYSAVGGCLTFKFTSDASFNGYRGFAADVTCGCAPALTAPIPDCVNKTCLTTVVNFNSGNTGSGSINDLSNNTLKGCLTTGEINTAWYYVDVLTSGDFRMFIYPNPSTKDYDFAVWKLTCGCPSGAPIRCSYSAPGGTTGISTAMNWQSSNPNEASEDNVTGDNWVGDLPVVAGDRLVIVIGDYTNSGASSAIVSIAGTATYGCLSTIFSATATSTNILCNGQCTGTGAVTPSCGSSPYTYAWNSSPAQNTQTATGLCAGTYTVLVTDATTATATATVTITQPPVLTAAATATTSCNGATATASAGGGSPGYAYAWSPSGGNAATATGLSSGNYTVTITDLKGCAKTATVAITQPPILTSTVSSTNPNCNGGTGSATITAGGGTPSYTYAWSPSGGNSSAATGLSAGNYTVTLFDASSCTKTSVVSITPPAVLTATATAANPNCNGGTGNASVTAGGGTPSYTYAWNPSGGNSSAATGLSAGNYTVMITDSKSCTKTATVSITQPPVLTAAATATTSCNGATATATAGGGNPAYTYAWSPSGGNAATATGLASGNYTVTIADAAGCTKTATVNITQPPVLTSTVSSTNPNCSGGTGNAAITAGGGNPAYTYAWSPSGGNSSAATGLSAGNYTVTLSDASGCTKTSIVSITQPAVLTSTVSSTNPNCNGGTGNASVTAGGGTPSYTYAWSPSGGNSSAATGLSAGNYTITLSDANGCTKTNSVSITQPAVLTSTISATNPNCNGGTGNAAITAGGGNPAYTYAWSPSGGNSSAATGLSAGNYSVTLSDASGCTKTATVSLTQPAALTATVSSTGATCGSSNGSATVIAGGGTGGYIYFWNPTGQTGTTATGLGAGSYTVTITDANGCTQTQTANVLNTNGPNATMSQTNLLCNGQCTGTSSATATGGTSPYTYSWSNGQTTFNATALCAANYTVIVTDATGCTTNQIVSIAQPPVLSATITSTGATCGSNNGSATVTANGGTGSYSYLWNPSGQTTSAATALGSGSYSVLVTDANGCTQTKTVTVTSMNTFSVSVSSTQTGCTVNNGTATANPTNGTAPYTYLWNPSGQTTSVATALGSGSYTVIVTDANGCTQTQAVSVTQISGSTAVATATTFSITQGDNTQLNATGGGTYSWSPVTGLSCTTCSSPTASPTTTTNYCVFVTDGNGCTDSACVTIHVEIPCEEIFIPNAFSPNGDGHNELECIRGSCIQTLSFTIFDRWGEKVFTTIDQNSCWDGTYKGKPEDTAVFVYYLEATFTNGEKINRKGNISLIR